ncbi:MAG: hypothetical protein ACKOBG_05110 [Actinomycetota bacterium]
MILLVVVAVVLTALMAFSWVAVAREPGPGPADVAIAYERAWDNLDFELLYHLSGEELRDGMRRERFVRVKRAAHDRAGTPVRLGTPIAAESSIAGSDAALVVTRIGSADEAIRNNVTLERRANGWVVVGYGLRVEPGPPAR